MVGEAEGGGVGTTGEGVGIKDGLLVGFSDGIDV